MAEHTPGPWAVHFRFGRLTTVNGRQRYPICDTGTAPRGEANDRREEANARLIAAAPELLHAAQLLEVAEDFNANDCRECEGEGVPELCPMCFPKFDDARVARRAAISKATGQ